MHSRRQFLKKLQMLMSALPVAGKASAAKIPTKKTAEKTSVTLYRAVNGSPAENLTRVIDLMGGIEKTIGSSDVVVIKPNVQWWNQGAPNLAAMKTLVDIIMNRPGGFDGEVVIAENCHRGPQPMQSAGWAYDFVRNADLDSILKYNDLSNHLKVTYGDRFSTCHWVDVDAGSKQICSPSDGTGYVYCDGRNDVPLISLDNGHKGNGFREVIMTYGGFLFS